MDWALIKTKKTKKCMTVSTVVFRNIKFNKAKGYISNVEILTIATGYMLFQCYHSPLKVREILIHYPSLTGNLPWFTLPTREKELFKHIFCHSFIWLIFAKRDGLRYPSRFWVYVKKKKKGKANWRVWGTYSSF